MKTIVNILFAAFTLTVFSFTPTQAETHKPIGRPQKAAAFQYSMYPTREGKLQISVSKQATGAVVVQMKNNQGTNILVEQIGKRQPAARLLLDVRDLPDGVYQIVMSNGVDQTTQTVTPSTTQRGHPSRYHSVRTVLFSGPTLF